LVSALITALFMVQEEVLPAGREREEYVTKRYEELDDLLSDI
jgi:hypothetical protein